jgi:hypothetical protein
MKQSEELEFLDLVVRYQDHALDEAGTSRLNHWIQGSTRARELFQDTALHALKVYELHNGGYAEYSCPSQAKRPKSGNRILGFPVRVWAAAAAVVFVAGLALFWNPGQSHRKKRNRCGLLYAR